MILTQNLFLIANIFRQISCDLFMAFVHPLQVLICVLRVQQFICTCVNDVGSDASACATHPSIQ